MKSIRWRLVFMYIALIVIVMISSGTFIIVEVRKSEYASAENVLRSDAKKIKQYIIDVYDSRDEFPIEFEGISDIALNADKEWNILDGKTGEIIRTSVTNDPLNYEIYKSSVIIEAMNGKESVSTNRQYNNINGLSMTWIQYAQPINLDENGKNPEYIIYVRMDSERIDRNVTDTTRTIAISMGFAMVLAGVLGVLFAGTITDPIRILTSKAKELAQGNLNQEIEVSSKDEIGQLTESFNNMARELSQTIKNMENEKNKMEIVLYNMTDGVLAYDGDGNLIHANQISQELLGVNEIRKLNINQMLKSIMPEVNDFDINDNDSYKDFTLNIGDKFINASFNPYKNKEGKIEGIVIVLQDITKHKKLDNMRKEFVANVSHEIRTPLTTIKSYTETLIDGAIDQKEIALDFLDVINSEADRMTLIVKDLLELSSLDNNQIVLNMQIVDLNYLVRQTVKSHSITAEKQNKTIMLEDKNKILNVMVDPSRISQVLGNIISNSIKYSADGSTIRVYIQENENHYKVFIQDNGFGIPKEDLRRIFERFYRVDKARSRAMGGTGLGLSIAKEIMQAHGGKISASSELGKGTTMILRFPKAD